MRIGIIGTGQIGSTLVRQYSKANHHVFFTNKSNHKNLRLLEIETGAKATSIDHMIKNAEVIVLSIPFVEVPKLAKSLINQMTKKPILIDATNYYPIRDGNIKDVENGMVESIWVSNQLSFPVVKAYNSIIAGSLVNRCLPFGAKHRIALPISGDNAHAKAVVQELINDSGFDSLDIGTLSESWKQQPGSPIYCTDIPLSILEKNLNHFEKENLPHNREESLKFILNQDPMKWLTWYNDCVLNNRKIFQTQL